MVAWVELYGMDKLELVEFEVSKKNSWLDPTEASKPWFKCGKECTFLSP